MRPVRQSRRRALALGRLRSRLRGEAVYRGCTTRLAGQSIRMTEPQSEPPPLNPRTYSPLGFSNQSWIVQAVIVGGGCVISVVISVVMGFLALAWWGLSKLYRYLGGEGLWPF